MTRLDRDRLTWLTYAQLSVFGYFLYGFGPSVALLRDEEGFSRAVAGLHGTALAVGALASSLVVAPLVQRFGRGPVIWGGLSMLGVGVLVYVGSPAPVTMLGAFLGSFGGSFAITSSAAVLTDRHGVKGASAVTEANAAAAGVGMLAPLVVGGAVALGVGWRSALLIVVPVLLALALVGRAVVVPAPGPPVEGTGTGRLPGRFWLSWVVLTAGIAVEFCLVLWTGDALRDRTDLSSAASAAGLTAVIAGMAAGRLVGGRLALRRSPERLLVGAISTALIGFAVFWLTTTAVVALGALVVCGLGVALFYPLGVVRAIGASQGRPDLASARGGLGAALAAGAGPFGLGALADQVGIHTALLVIPGLLLVAAVGVAVDRRPRLVATGG